MKQIAPYDRASFIITGHTRERVPFRFARALSEQEYSSKKEKTVERN